MACKTCAVFPVSCPITCTCVMCACVCAGVFARCAGGGQLLGKKEEASPSKSRTVRQWPEEGAFVGNLLLRHTQGCDPNQNHNKSWIIENSTERIGSNRTWHLEPQPKAGKHPTNICNLDWGCLFLMPGRITIGRKWSSKSPNRGQPRCVFDGNEPLKYNFTANAHWLHTVHTFIVHTVSAMIMIYRSPGIIDACMRLPFVFTIYSFRQVPKFQFIIVDRSRVGEREAISFYSNIIS